MPCGTCTLHAVPHHRSSYTVNAVSRPAVLQTLMQCPAPQYLEEEGLDIKALLGFVLDREHELVVEARNDLRVCGTESSRGAAG